MSEQARRPLVAKAQSLIAAGRRRAEFFPASMFHEGAWNMVLHLYIARDRNTPEYVSTVCKASGVPMTSALRAFDFLVNNGFVNRAEDDLDHRRYIVSLSALGVRQIEAYLSA